MAMNSRFLHFEHLFGWLRSQIINHRLCSPNVFSFSYMMLLSWGGGKCPVLGGGDCHKNSYSSIWAYGHSLTYFYSPADSAERVYGVRMTCTELETDVNKEIYCRNLKFGWFYRHRVQGVLLTGWNHLRMQWQRETRSLQRTTRKQFARGPGIPSWDVQRLPENHLWPVRTAINKAIV